MKISKSDIKAAIHRAKQSGTTYYRITLEDIQENEDMNVWVKKSFDERGWDAIDFSNKLYGSKVIGNKLYLCVTDGYDINVDGKNINPEEALDEYAIDDLQDYIKDKDDDIIDRYITTYEIFEPDFNEWAVDILTTYDLDFSDVVRDYSEFDV